MEIPVDSGELPARRGASYIGESGKLLIDFVEMIKESFNARMSDTSTSIP